MKLGTAGLAEHFKFPATDLYSERQEEEVEQKDDKSSSMDFHHERQIEEGKGGPKEHNFSPDLYQEMGEEEEDERLKDHKFSSIDSDIYSARGGEKGEDGLKDKFPAMDGYQESQDEYQDVKEEVKGGAEDFKVQISADWENGFSEGENWKRMCQTGCKNLEPLFMT